MNYKSISDLNRDILEWIPNIPRDIDVIVGIPRSGLLVANILGLHLNLPITDVDGLIERQVLSSGRRLPDVGQEIESGSKIFVIDDSICSGYQINETKEQIGKESLPFDIIYGALYVTPSSTSKVQYWKQKLRMPRVFEWNLFHNDILNHACVDIDGVLCRDPSKDENDDGSNYEYFISNIEPNIIPTERIGWLVTCRLEKYRDLTTDWLKRLGIKYDHLIMMDYSSKEERLRMGNHAEYKAKVYTQCQAKLFIESSKKQAITIANKSGKPVICYEGNSQIIYPHSFGEIKRKTIDNTHLLFSNPKRFMSKGLRKIRRKIGL
jgi:orotate phosphoribosyltransferase